MARKAKSESPVIINAQRFKAEQVEELFDRANEELQTKLKYMVQCVTDEVKSVLIARYELGGAVTDIKDDKGGVYGKGAISLMNKVFDFDRSVLSTAEQIYRTLSRWEIEEYAEKRMADGITPLSYTHIRWLTSLKDVKERDEAVKLCLANCWNSNQLGEYVKRRKGELGEAISKGGRKRAIPKDAETVIKQQMGIVNDFQELNTKVWKQKEHSLSTHVAKLSPAQYTEDLAKQLGELAHRLRQVAEEARLRAEEAERQFELVKTNLDVLNVQHIADKKRAVCA